MNQGLGEFVLSDADREEYRRLVRDEILAPVNAQRGVRREVSIEALSGGRGGPVLFAILSPTSLDHQSAIVQAAERAPTLGGRCSVAIVDDAIVHTHHGAMPTPTVLITIRLHSVTARKTQRRFVVGLVLLALLYLAVRAWLFVVNIDGGSAGIDTDGLPNARPLAPALPAGPNKRPVFN